MIHSVTANKTSFKSVRFEKGLNLIVAIRTKGETDKNTRNGVGKSTLFRIIDFCLGSDVNKPGTLMAKLNVEGSQGMEALSRELDFPFQQIGSLVVCTDPEQAASEYDYHGMHYLGSPSNPVYRNTT